MRGETVCVHALKSKVMGAKYVCCTHNTNFMGTIAPTPPMVPTPMLLDVLTIVDHVKADSESD